MPVRVQLHGHFTVLVDGRAVEPLLPGRRGRLLVAYLAAHADAAVDRTAVLDVLWPGAVPGERSSSHLAPLLSKVRAVVAPLEIHGRRSLQLVLPPDAVLDTRVAASALHAADAAAARGDPRAAWTAALSALFVLQRTFLPDHDDPWVRRRRSALELDHRRALAVYAEACLALGPTELASAERSARRLVEADPLGELGWCLLMRALDRRGDRAAALAVYERLRCVLRDELGADPSPASRRLHSELLGAQRT